MCDEYSFKLISGTDYFKITIAFAAIKIPFYLILVIFTSFITFVEHLVEYFLLLWTSTYLLMTPILYLS